MCEINTESRDEEAKRETREQAQLLPFQPSVGNRLWSVPVLEVTNCHSEIMNPSWASILVIKHV